VGVDGLIFVRLTIEIWEIGESGTKGEVGSGVGKWGKQCGGCWVLCPLCMFGCISVVV
jgi:hypothetical protein